MSASHPAVVDGVITVAAVVLLDGQGWLLTVRKRGTERFMLPGGKPEPGESPAQTAAREAAEEVGLRVDPGSLALLGEFTTDAANEPGHLLVSTVYLAPTTYDGPPAADAAPASPAAEVAPAPPAGDGRADAESRDPLAARSRADAQGTAAVVETGLVSARTGSALAAAAEIAELRWLDPRAPLPDDLAPLLRDAVVPALLARA